MSAEIYVYLVCASAILLLSIFMLKNILNLKKQEYLLRESTVSTKKFKDSELLK